MCHHRLSLNKCPKEDANLAKLVVNAVRPAMPFSGRRADHLLLLLFRWPRTEVANMTQLCGMLKMPMRKGTRAMSHISPKEDGSGRAGPRILDAEASQPTVQSGRRIEEEEGPPTQSSKQKMSESLQLRAKQVADYVSGAAARMAALSLVRGSTGFAAGQQDTVQASASAFSEQQEQANATKTLAHMSKAVEKAQQAALVLNEVSLAQACRPAPSAWPML
jgi:hypothetical protein